MKENRKPVSISLKISSYFAVISLQAVIFAIWLLALPGEAENAQFLGYSFRRLILLIPLLLPALGLIFRIRISDWITSKKDKWQQDMPIVAGFIGIFTGFLWTAIFFYHFLRIFGDVGFYVRLLPLMLHYLLIGIESLYLIISIYPAKLSDKSPKNEFPWKIFLVSFALVLATAIIMYFTGWGSAVNRLVIVSLGVPLLEGQIIYIAGLLFIILLTAVSTNLPSISINDKKKFKWDAIIFFTIWLIAVILWASQPLPEHNYFAPSERERPPNFEKYPFSDAEQYDYNSLYVLYGSLENFVISKPFYVSFLAILHTIAGLDYTKMVFLQTLVIALFPAVLYLIGKELHSRLGGVAIALLVILRELNSIQASTMANVSNVKLLISEGLAALLIGLLSLVLIRWFKSKEKKLSNQAFIAGGIVGMLILTRLQTMLLIPFITLLVIIRFWGSFKRGLLGIALIILALALVLTPILIRNHAITGVYWVDNPSSTAGLYSYYTLDTGLEVEIPKAETQGDQLRRNLSVMAQAIISGFGQISDRIMDNFFRNEASAFLTLPIRLGNEPELLDLLMIREPFWAEFYTRPNAINLVTGLVSMALLSLGIATAFKKQPQAVLVFLGLHLVYSMSSAVVRLSGWRFIKSADWMLFAFFALGIVEIFACFGNHSKNWSESIGYEFWLDQPGTQKKRTYSNFANLSLAALFLLSGGFIPFRELLLPKSIPEYSREKICAIFESALEASEPTENFPSFSEYCMSEENLVYSGYGIYPRYFKAGEGYYDRPNDPYFGEQPFSRLVFRMIGEINAKFLLKTSEPDIYFPNGSEVFTIVNKEKSNEVNFLMVMGETSEILISDPVLAAVETSHD